MNVAGCVVYEFCFMIHRMAMVQRSLGSTFDLDLMSLSLIPIAELELNHSPVGIVATGKRWEKPRRKALDAFRANL